MECGEGRNVRDVRWQELTKQECFELLAGQPGLRQSAVMADAGGLTG
jgi:hypothetical protein